MVKNGFTLIELLLVLSIFSFLTLLAVPLQLTSLNKQEEKQFIELFKDDVLLIQNQASLNSKNRMYIRFFDDHYKILQGTKPAFSERDFPNGWNLVGTNRVLEFSETGTIIQPRTIVIYSEDERIAFIFPLGKGRFHLEKEKRVLHD